jgi:hypothetical protein
MEDIALDKIALKKIDEGIETWIHFAENARSYLVSEEMPTSVTDTSQIIQYAKV